MILAVLLAAGVGTEASAQLRYGVMGGFTFANTNHLKSGTGPVKTDGGLTTNFHGGLTAQLRLPLGFSVQPSLLYQVKGAAVSNVMGDSNVDLKVGYMELAASLQWGPDLLLFRPFLDVTPFVGYGIHNKMVSADFRHRNSWEGAGLNRWEYGIGLGIGLEIWKFQVIGRYNWNLGSLYGGGDEAINFKALAKHAFEGHNFNGFTLSVAILFGK